MTDLQPEDLARDMLRDLDAMNQRNGHIGLVRRYLKNDHDLPYMPKDASSEYASIARKSITNWLSLISSTFSKSLFVDGYRTGKSATNADAWKYWQANKMDARQTIAMRGAIEYGTSYVLVRPGDSGPVIKPMPARKTLAWYEDDDDEFPVCAIVRTGQTLDGKTLFDFYMGDSIYTFERQGPKPLNGVPDDPFDPHDGRELRAREGELKLVRTEKHGMGNFVPWVRFRDRLDDEAVGLIRPLIGTQDRINETVFVLHMAIHYASFRQRWATGLEVPRDQDEKLPDGSENPNFGKPIEPFKTAVDRLWISEGADTRFGDFPQTDVSGHLQAYDATVRTLISIAESTPLVLVGDLSNLSTEAVSILNDSMNRKVAELQVLFGESWEQVFALASIADGKDYDPTAQVRWKDTEPRSFAAIVDGLVKLRDMGAPAEGLWELVPGLTDQDIETWKELARNSPSIEELVFMDARRQLSTPEAA